MYTTLHQQDKKNSQYRPFGYYSTGKQYQLFLIALCRQDKDAWTKIQKQYAPLISDWLSNLDKNQLSIETKEDLTQEAFVRFWHALVKKKQTHTKDFPHLGAILKYLKCCTTSAFLDWQRKETQMSRLEQQIEAQLESPVTNSLAHDIEQQEELANVHNWLRNRVNDPCEKLLIQLHFFQGLSPKQIADKCPEFDHSKDVYRVKERLLKRAKRALIA